MAREHLQTPVSLDEIGLQRWPACISSVARIERAIFVSMEDAARRWRLFENPTFATLEWPSLRFSTHYGKHLEDEHLKSTAAGGRARSIRANSDFCSRWGLPSGAVPPPRIMRHRLRRICRSPSLPPEERELPDVLAGRHHQRAQCEHAGLAYGALELRELREPVARLGVDRRLVHAALAQQQYAFGAQRELPVQSQAAQHVRQVLAAEARAQRLQVATAVAVEEPTGIDRLQQLHVGVEVGIEPVAQRALAVPEHEVDQERQHNQGRKRRERGLPEQGVEATVQRDRREKARQQQLQTAVRSALVEGDRDHRQDSRRAAMHDRGAE